MAGSLIHNVASMVTSRDTGMWRHGRLEGPKTTASCKAHSHASRRRGVQPGKRESRMRRMVAPRERKSHEKVASGRLPGGQAPGPKEKGPLPITPIYMCAACRVLLFTCTVPVKVPYRRRRPVAPSGRARDGPRPASALGRTAGRARRRRASCFFRCGRVRSLASAVPGVGGLDSAWRLGWGRGSGLVRCSRLFSLI